MPVTNRNDISVGQEVEVVLKKDQSTGTLTRGHVARILTKKYIHTRGIKVELVEDGMVGRVQNIIR